jgi:poly(A) polymerase
MANPEIIPRPEHTLSRKSVSQNALKVLYRLKEAGAQAFLVGGSVRDILLEIHPKDFDIATDFHPEQVKLLFRNCLLIGRRFRLAHIRFGKEIIEVATFRGSSDTPVSHSEHGMILHDNVYGSLEEDVERRDFTVNALYYSIENFGIVDFCKGMDDIKHQTIRLIGDPDIRYREDPVRLLRAVRFAAKLHFTIETNSEKPLFQLGALLAHVPPARLFDEFLKLFLKGHAFASFTLLRHYGLLHHLFLQTVECFESNQFKTMLPLLEKVLHDTDERLRTGKKVTPAFLLAAFLWYPLKKTIIEMEHNHHTNKLGLLIEAIQEVFSKQAQQVFISRRFMAVVQEIWLFQNRLESIQKKSSLRLLNHPRFRAAYDFLLLRASAGENVHKQANFWTHIQTLNEEDREAFFLTTQPVKKRLAANKQKKKA